MDVVATLIEATVFDPVTSTSQVIRVTNRNDPRATTFNGQTWMPVLNSAPDIGMSVFNGDFTGRSDVSLGSFTITLADGLADSLATMNWHGADIKIFAGDLTDGIYAQIFRCLGNGASRQGRLQLTVELTTQIDRLNTNLLYLSYSGLGGVEGNSGLKGVLKPFCVGDAKFCPAVLIDDARQIYQVHGYGPIEGVYSVFEGGLAIGTGPAQSYSSNQIQAFFDDALVQGTWTRLSEYGLFRLASAPSYPITCHAKGDTGGVVGGTALNRAGDLVRRMITMATGMTVKASSVTALNAAQTSAFDDYYNDQVSVADACYDLLLGFGGYLTFNENAELIMGRVRLGEPQLTLSGSADRLPTVLGINQLPASSPVWKFRLGAEQCHYVHQASDIVAAIQEIIENGNLGAGNKIFPPSPTPPEGAEDGDLWPDTSSVPTIMRRYDGQTGTWVAISSYVRYGTDIGVENGATVGAPPGTPVGSLDALEVVEQINFNADSIAKTFLSVNGFEAFVNARTYYQGQPLSTVFAQEKIERIDGQNALVSNMTLLGAKSPDGSAWILNMDGVKTGIDETTGQPISMGNKLTQIGNRLGNHDSQIDFLMDSTVTPNGAIAKAVLRVTADGYVAGFSLTSNGNEGVAAFLVDVFKIVDPNGGQPFTPFLIADGTVKMLNVEIDKLAVGSVKSSAIGVNETRRQVFWRATTLGSGPEMIPTEGAWGPFGPAGNTARGTVPGVPSGGQISIRMFINAQRTGGNDDRVRFRLKRISPTFQWSYLETITVGLVDSPSMISYEWNDTNIFQDGTYTYELEAWRLAGEGMYFSGKLAIDAGKR